MKKFLISALAASTMLVATPALADNSLQYNLTATVGAVCGVYAASSTIPVSFGDLATVTQATVVTPGATSASYRCNSPNGFTRRITSLNNGKLVRGGSNGDASNSIAFRMVHGGGSGLAFTATQLTAPLSTNLGASTAFAAGQTGSVSFQVNGVADNTTNNNSALGTTVFAGTYTDTVTIAVTAN